MTQKEKAEELFKKMDVIHYMKLGGKNSNSKGLPISMHNDQVKQCALIAVDELIKETGSKYWYDVKQEIEKL